MAKKELSYRESIEAVEVILEKIENGETDVDQLAEEIKKAAKLLQSCKDKLIRTEEEVAQIINGNDD